MLLILHKAKGVSEPIMLQHIIPSTRTYHDTHAFFFDFTCLYNMYNRMVFSKTGQSKYIRIERYNTSPLIII